MKTVWIVEEKYNNHGCSIIAVLPNEEMASKYIEVHETKELPLYYSEYKVLDEF